MTAVWDGRPQNPEREGWHWVQHRDNAPEVLNWSPLHDWHYEGDWVYPGFIGQNYRYIGPCLTPAEIEARVAQARREALEDAARLHDEHAADLYAWAQSHPEITAAEPGYWMEQHRQYEQHLSYAAAIRVLKGAGR